MSGNLFATIAAGISDPTRPFLATTGGASWMPSGPSDSVSTFSHMLWARAMETQLRKRGRSQGRVCVSEGSCFLFMAEHNGSALNKIGSSP